MKLIDLVRETRENGHRYLAIDRDSTAFSYDFKPTCTRGYWSNSTDHKHSYISNYQLTCNWKNSLVDVTKLKGVK